MPDNPKKKIIENFISRTKIYLGIIAILFIVICIYDKRLIIPSIIIYILIAIYSALTNKKKKGEYQDHIQELMFDIDSVAKSTLVNVPFPVVIVETSGKILWKSMKFTTEFANIDIGNYINDIVKENNKKVERINKSIKIENKNYKVIGRVLKNAQRNKKSNAISLFFLDETDYRELIEKYNDAQICIGIIMIDNYEETIARLDVETKAQTIAKIEKEIYRCASETGGLIIKTERDTFIYIFEQKYLNEIKNNKFNILDTIKEIDSDGKLQLTLSIAVSNEGKTEYEKYKSATTAIELALGRGGDQAVVRENEKYIFFGGRTQEVEKRTKVKARTIASGLEELMKNSSNIMIMGHMNPDIDSIGSSIGIYRYAKTLGKECYIINNTSSQTINAFIEELKKEPEYQKNLLNKQEALAKITDETLLIIVDTHKKSYVEIPEILEKTKKKVIIDHHRKSTDFIDDTLLVFHEVYASSAAELVIEIIQYAEQEIKLKQIEAESLYAGIMVDTKNFTFKTGVRTFEAAAYLRKCGVDILRVKKWFQSDLEDYILISDIVKGVEIINETIGIATYEQKSKNAGLICAKVADELLTISDITASFVIGDLGDKICISGRSIGDINVQVILEKLRRWRTHNLSGSTT